MLKKLAIIVEGDENIQLLLAALPVQFKEAADYASVKLSEPKQQPQTLGEMVFAQADKGLPFSKTASQEVALLPETLVQVTGPIEPGQ